MPIFNGIMPWRRSSIRCRPYPGSPRLATAGLLPAPVTGTLGTTSSGQRVVVGLRHLLHSVPVLDDPSAPRPEEVDTLQWHELHLSTGSSHGTPAPSRRSGHRRGVPLRTGHSQSG